MVFFINDNIDIVAVVNRFGYGLVVDGAADVRRGFGQTTSTNSTRCSRLELGRFAFNLGGSKN